MINSEKKELLDILVQNYLYEKENNKVWQRKNSDAYSLAKGKLFGACMALDLDLEETTEALTIFTSDKKNIVTKIEIKQNE